MEGAVQEPLERERDMYDLHEVQVQLTLAQVGHREVISSLPESVGCLCYSTSYWQCFSFFRWILGPIVSCT